MTLLERLRQRVKPIRQRLHERAGNDLHESYDSLLTEAALRIEALESALAELVHTKDEARKAEFGGPGDLASLMSKHAIAWQAARRAMEK